MRYLAVIGLLFAGGCRSNCSTAGSSRLHRLIAQLEGRCCEFVAQSGSCRELGLAQFITQPQLECVRSAALCLGQLGGAAAPAVPALLGAAKDGPNNYDTGDGVIAVRDAVIESLGSTGDPRVLGAVIEALEQPQPVDAAPSAAGYSSRRPTAELAALQALRNLGPVAKPAVPHILPFLRHPDAPVATATVRALAAIGDPSALPPLVRLIEESPDRDDEITVRDAIRTIGGPARRSRPPAVLHRHARQDQRSAQADSQTPPHPPAPPSPRRAGGDVGHSTGRRQRDSAPLA